MSPRFRPESGRRDLTVLSRFLLGGIFAEFCGQIASAVGKADLAAAVGGPKNPFGGIGSNGALPLQPSANFIEMLPVQQDYSFVVGQVYNLKADRYISEHCDVTGHEEAHAFDAASAAS